MFSQTQSGDDAEVAPRSMESMTSSFPLLCHFTVCVVFIVWDEISVGVASF